MITSSASEDILSAKSVNITPVVFTEWNYNLFYPPYITTAGNGDKKSFETSTPVPSESLDVVKENFTTTKKITVSGTESKIVFPKTSGLGGKAYKIVSYIRTSSLSPIVVNAYAKSTNDKFGSFSDEAVSFSWKKIELCIGGNDAIDSFTFTISVSSKNNTDTGYDVYFTEPEIYETTSFDYFNGNLWTTKSPFTYLRPGESYVSTGASEISLPNNYRRIKSKTHYDETESGGFYGNKYMPISRVVYNPKSIIINNPAAYSGASTAYQNPLLKNGMISDMIPYKYFVSDETSKKISAIYEKDININKIVLKFNAMIYKPTLSITIGSITLTNQTTDDNGILILYWDGTTWSSTKKWSTTSPVPSGKVAMPYFDSEGIVTLKTAIKKITIEQTGQTINPLFNNSYFTVSEFQRMSLIECSPRLEVDISNLTESFNVQKSLDNKSSSLPISFMESNDASFTFSDIPAYSTAKGVVPIFSNESTNQYSILNGMLRRNVKFYSYFKINEANNFNDVNQYSNEYIPAGVFYSDNWSSSGDSKLTIQAFDITRYLQTLSVVDYAGQLLRVEDIISNLLDFAGFTDYDYDSLHDVTNDNNIGMDLAYYFANSKEKTVFECLREIFSAYQICSFIDEYGIMRFKSLPNIILNQNADLTINDSLIVDDGYSTTIKEKPGKVSMKYAPPKIKRSASLQNIEDISIKLSPSFILTTQNDVVWQQQNDDSVGFNYLQESFAADKNKFKLKIADLLDIFYTYSRDYDGYAFIEDEIVSFKHKEYTISQVSKPENTVTVSIKNDFELKSKINQFAKEYGIGLGNQIEQSTTAVYDSGGASGSTSVIISSPNSKIKVGQIISGTGFASNSKVMSVSGTTIEFSPAATAQISGSITFSEKNTYDILVQPTGWITNVGRGMFGTKVKDHNIITDLASKGLQEKLFSSGAMTPAANTIIEDNKIKVTEANGDTVYIYPITERDEGYKTYSITFSPSLPSSAETTTGIFFNCPASETSLSGMYEVSFGQDPTSGKYFIYISYNSSVLYMADVTKIANQVYNNVPQVYKPNTSYSEGSTSVKKYTSSKDRFYHLKVVHKEDDPEVGNIDAAHPGEEIIRVYLNGIEIKQWGILDANDEISRNNLGLPRSPALPDAVSEGTIFGAIFRGSFETAAGTSFIRELYASTEALEADSDFYFHKTQYFLNALACNRKIEHKSYLMQTNPSASGLNYYDVQYTTPAATTVDVYPVKYLLIYQPTSSPTDAQYRQSILVVDDHLRYSCPINTGFRGKMFIANNSAMTIFLNKDADGEILTTTRLNLYTHQIIAMSDEQIIDFDIQESNSSETVQLESEWVQSTDSAYSILNTISSAIDGFSVDINLDIFGNPLIQLGDVVLLSYSLAGITNQKYIVTNVSHQFNQGLSTSLKLNRIS